MEGVEHLKQSKEKISKSEFSQPTKTVDLIGYQEGSVVSRTIVDKKAGTVTLFAFDKNQGLSEHTAPYDALVHTLDGQAEITIAGRSVVVQAGDIVVLPANKPHALRAIEKFKMLLVMIRS
jgi:quercetin dioxygenase-like cupin family protein